MTLVSAFGRDGSEPRWILLLEGGVSLLAGAVALFYPRATALLFLYLLAGWALLSGLVEIVAAYRLRAEIRGEFWLGFAGVLSVLFGLMLLVRPGAGALTVVWLIASFSVLYGVVLIAWGLHLRRLQAQGAAVDRGAPACLSSCSRRRPFRTRNRRCDRRPARRRFSGVEQRPRRSSR